MSCESAPEPVTATVADDVELPMVIEFDTRAVVAVKVLQVISGDNWKTTCSLTQLDPLFDIPFMMLIFESPEMYLSELGVQVDNLVAYVPVASVPLVNIFWYVASEVVFVEWLPNVVFSWACV